ncbi:MAG: aldehyde dehydrogenase family protein [Mycobacterium sp.]
MSTTTRGTATESVTRAFIGGQSVPTGDTYDNIDPATGHSLGAVVRCGSEEVDRAVSAARTASRTWSRTSVADRVDVLTRIADSIDQNRERLALLECQDTGKPLGQARTDAAVSARYFRFYGHAIETYQGHTIPLSPDLHVYTRREPLGVTGHILAWNYPMQLLSRAVAPAIATGNCCVVKPADETPRTAVEFARLSVEAGLPPGVFNVVPGPGAEAGFALSTHGDVDHLGFVGSTATGSLIAHAAADRVLPTTLELGGKSPQIVFPDADLSRATEFIVKAVLQNAGQTCSAGSRLLVHESIHDELVDRVRRRFDTITIGPGAHDRDLGPLISRKQQDRVKDMVGADTRGEVICGGGPPTDPALAGGAYFAPTLIDDVDPESVLAQQEIFGPVLTVHRFGDEDEAVALANGTEYGLLAAIWTTNLSRAHRMAADIVAGQVYVNTYGAGGGVELPFGGFKKSGYGREKGREALDAMTATKTVVISL